MNIVVLDGYTENPGDLSWDGLSALGSLTVYDRTPPEQVLERIGAAEIVYTNKTVLSRDSIMAMKNVRFIGVLATGYNVVDAAAARERGIAVCNVPTYGTGAVAQFAFALLLELCHHVGDHNRAVQEGRWTSCRDFCFWDYPLTELAGKTLGIIGYGRIGRRTAEIARAFGMRVLAYSRSASDGACVSLENLLRESDVISLHCPLTEETREIIRAETIAQMKDGAMLINTARGPLVRESDLADALRSDKLAAAAMDVAAVEPVQPDNPLLGLPNCIITPHIAWAPKESRQRLMDVAVENLRCFLDGHPQNVVN